MIRLVTRKDLATLWTSALPYAVAVVFNATAGILFVDQLAGRRQAVVQPLFPIAGFLVLVLVPILTMRSVAEEDRSGTLDLLRSAEVPYRAIVVGKWLASWLTALVALAPIAVVPLLLSWWGDPDWGPVITGFAGLVLLAAAAAAVGVLTSSCTRSQAVAALASTFVGLALWFAGSSDDGAGAAGVLARFSVSERLRSFAGGAVDTSDVTFFAAVTVAALAAARWCVAARER